MVYNFWWNSKKESWNNKIFYFINNKFFFHLKILNIRNFTNIYYLLINVSLIINKINLIKYAIYLIIKWKKFNKK